jgi:hypothetical protein
MPLLAPPMCLSPRRAFVTLAAPDFGALVDFYQQLLGQSPQPFLPQHYAEFRLGSLSLGIFWPKPEHGCEFAQAAHSPLSLCLEVADLDLALAQLSPLNCRQGDVMEASHGREVYVYDPLGNRLILYQPYAAQANDPADWS